MRVFRIKIMAMAAFSEEMNVRTKEQRAGINPGSSSAFLKQLFSEEGEARKR